MFEQLGMLFSDDFGWILEDEASFSDVIGLLLL